MRKKMSMAILVFSFFLLLSPIHCWADQEETENPPNDENSTNTQVASSQVSDENIVLANESEVIDQVDNGLFGDEEAYYGNAYDPLEELNRATFSGNDKFVYRPVFFPISDAWEENVHDKAREAISNIAHCGSMPVRVFSDLMQLEAEKAIIDFWSIFNVFTLCTVDIYTPDDKFDKEDVSQGLAKMGVPEGVTITWPIFGPSNLRNTVGTVADTFLNAQTYIGFPANVIIATVVAINDPGQKNSYREFENAVDQYAATRDGFRSNQNKKIRTR